MTEPFIPPHGGYKGLLAFQKAEIVYDATVKFCADLLDKRDRTVDQMVQAARSGKQNIVEGSTASGIPPTSPAASNGSATCRNIGRSSG